MDKKALNYDKKAEKNDGSCIYMVPPAVAVDDSGTYECVRSLGEGRGAGAATIRSRLWPCSALADWQKPPSWGASVNRVQAEHAKIRERFGKKSRNKLKNSR